MEKESTRTERENKEEREGGRKGNSAVLQREQYEEQYSESVCEWEKVKAKGDERVRGNPCV